MIGTGIGLGLAGYRLRTSFEAMPSLDLQFADRRMIQAVLGPTPSFSRASTGTYFDSQGVLKSAAVNGPRFNHTFNGTSWVSRGLLIEEQRTNLIIHSNLQSTWTATNATLTSTTETTSPDGTNNARKLTEDTTATDYHYAELYPQSPQVYSGYPYTVSVFVKSNGRTKFYISGGTSRCPLDTYFNLVSGTVISSIASSSSITAVGNGWYRCTATQTASSTGASGFQLVLVDDSANPIYTGDGTKGVFVFGYQVEEGAFPTSLIPTTAAAATRSASVCQLNGADFSSIWNVSEGTLIIEGDSVANGTTPFVCLDDNTSSERIEIYGSGTDPKVLVVDGGSAQVDIDAGTISNGTAFKLAFSYKLNDFAVSLNGGTVATDTVGTLPTVDRLRIGSNQAGNYLNGHIARLRYYPTRLTNAKLQELST